MRRIRSILSACPICLGLLSQAAIAGPVFNEVIDTSSLFGTTGAFDFNFNPGPLGPLPATVTISGLSTDGTLLPNPSLVGQASGLLPGSVTLSNGLALNDYFQQFVFGTRLAFTISIDGQAVDAPDPTSPSGSAFVFSLFSDASGTVPALTSDLVNGFAVTIEVNPDGSTTRTSFVTTGPNNVSEPASLCLAALGLACASSVRRRALAAVRQAQTA